MRPDAFGFRGRVPDSKSFLIRALLQQAWEPAIDVSGDSDAGDVRAMREALGALHRSAPADCGEGALVLRLLLGYAGRRPGAWKLVGSPRLAKRPHGPLIDALAALGVRIERQGDRAFGVEGEGWHRPTRPVALDRSASSQFLTALLLNAWRLDFPLEIRLVGSAVSRGYAAMSLAMARDLGMRVEERGEAITVPARQEPVPRSLRAPADMGAAFAVAAVALVAGDAVIEDFEIDREQPDAAFLEALAGMGARIEAGTRRLHATFTPALSPIDADLRDAPDLLPLLGVLCALAEGRSRLHGAPQARLKESDRIASTARLVTAMGREARADEDRVEIDGRPFTAEDRRRERSEIDVTGDHRMGFAAAVAAWAGFPLRVRGFEAVAKSFPAFASIAGRPELEAFPEKRP